MRFSLKLRASAAITLLFLGMMALIATVQTRFIRADLVDAVTAQQLDLVRAAADELDVRLQTNLRALTQEALVIPPEILADPKRLQTYLERQPAMLQLFDALLIFSPNGEVVADAPRIAGRTGTQAGDREYFKRSVATRKPVISEPFLARATQRPAVTMTAPMLDKDGQLVGFLAGTIDLLKPNFLGGLASSRIGRTGYFFALTKEQPSVYVVHPDLSLILNATGADAIPGYERAMIGHEGTSEGVDVHGVPGLFSYISLATTNWVLATNYPLAEALAPVIAAERRLWTITAFLATLVAPVVWLLTWFLIAPLLRLRDDVLRLRQGTGAISPGLQARKDEIGDLARGFNVLIAGRQHNEEALRRSTQLLDNIVENIPAAIQLKSIEDHFRFVMWNKAAETLFGLPRERVIGQTTLESWTAEDVVRLREADSLAVASNGQEFTRRPLTTTNGGTIIGHMRKVPLFDDNGVATHLLVIVDDVTDRVAAEAKLAESEARLQASEHRLRTIADTMPAAIAYVDRQQVYGFANTAFERLFNLTPEQVRGCTIHDVLAETGFQTIERYLDRAFDGERVTFEREQSWGNGIRWIQATYIPEIDESNNEVVGVHAMLLDITAQKDEQQRLLRLSQVDALTGLANRVGFEQRLSDAMAETRTTGQALAVMYFDIDHFKQINDKLGHAAGDALLAAFAQRLRNSLRKTDLVARLGGDEFVVVMERVGDAKTAARLGAQALEEILRPFALDHGAPLTITTSVGIACFNGGATTAGQLVAEADAMLYAAKRKGRNNVCIAPWPHQATMSQAQLH